MASDGNAFETSIDGIKSVWGPLSSQGVADCCRHIENLLKAPATEGWLAGGAAHPSAR